METKRTFKPSLQKEENIVNFFTKILSQKRRSITH